MTIQSSSAQQQVLGRVAAGLPLHRGYLATLYTLEQRHKTKWRRSGHLVPPLDGSEYEVTLRGRLALSQRKDVDLAEGGPKLRFRPG